MKRLALALFALTLVALPTAARLAGASGVARAEEAVKAALSSDERADLSLFDRAVRTFCAEEHVRFYNDLTGECEVKMMVIGGDDGGT